MRISDWSSDVCSSDLIIVSGAFQRNRQDILSGTSVLTGTELTRQLKPTTGETLANQPGVSATSFGPNASRPVLRGFQGERVRVLTDGIGRFDVSNTSVDHAVVINPLTADRIEVLRGPSALLYGSEIGSASCRERWCQYVSITVFAVSLKKKEQIILRSNPSH